MKKAILARKEGMTQIFDDSGRVIPVTVLKAGPCKVIMKRTADKDGYKSLQVGFEEKKPSRVNKPERGHFDRAQAAPMRVLKEFRLENADEYEPGQEITSDIFAAGDKVDISGISKGKGFAGSIKRHNQSTGPKTHGSHYHRGPGTLGAMEPSKVFKGRPLPGRMGGKTSTVLNLEVVEVDPDNNVLLVKGAVPGHRGTLLEVRESVKKKKTG